MVIVDLLLWLVFASIIMSIALGVLYTIWAVLFWTGYGVVKLAVRGLECVKRSLG